MKNNNDKYEVKAPLGYKLSVSIYNDLNLKELFKSLATFPPHVLTEIDNSPIKDIIDGLKGNGFTVKKIK